MAAEVEREDRDVATMEDMLTTGTFIVNKKAHQVVIESKLIKWRKVGKSNIEYDSVCFDAVFAVISGPDTEKGAGTNGSKCTKPNTETKEILSYFTLHYVNKTPAHLWKAQTVTFSVPENHALDLTPWVGRIKGYITSPELGRPKHLLVFINPNSGWGKGVQIYDNKTAPLFKLAGVATDVTVTENGDHAGQVLSECDLNQIDGVVSVGGDGSFLKCFDGLLRRLSKDAEIDLNDATANPVRPSIPLGIIPAGTGQSVIKEMTNTKDPVTATLQIIMGERHVLHAHSVYNGGKLISFGVILAAYGIYGDFIRISEKVNLGRAKYVYSFGKALTSKRSFNAEIHYRPVPGENTVDASESGWEIVTGSFCSVHMFIMDLSQMGLAKKIKKAGFVPKDPKIQTMNLYLATQECPRLRFLKSFIGRLTGDDSAVDNHYITIRPIKECKIVIDVPELNEETSCLTIDGEPNTLVDKTVHIKGHPNLLPVFGAGVHKILGLDKLLKAASEQEKGDEEPVSEL